MTLKFKKTVATMKLYENKSKRHKMVLHASRCRQILIHIRYFHASGHSKHIYTEQNLYFPFSYITQFVTTFMLKKSYFIVLKYFKFYPMVWRIINLLIWHINVILVSRSYIYFNWTLHSTFYHFYSRLQEQLHGKHIIWKHSTFYRNVLFYFRCLCLLEFLKGPYHNKYFELLLTCLSKFYNF